MIGDAIAGVVGQIISRVWPDPAQKAQITLEIERMQQAGEFKLIDAELERGRQQTEINKAEAQSVDRFVAGWRPFIGWVCGSALAWHYIGRPVADWVLMLAGNTTPIPAVDIGDLIVILLGMLGLGGLRTAEKVKGVAR